MTTRNATTIVTAIATGLAAVLLAGQVHAQGRIRLALLPIVVHSAEPPEYLRLGLADMLASRLERIRDFDVVRVDEPDAATTSLAKALAHARKLDAEFVLFGSFTRFGTGASLDVQCAGTSSTAAGQEPLREIFVHSGSIGEVIPDLDDLVGKVARFVIADYSERVAEATGEAPELPSSAAVKQLQERLDALEAALGELNRRLETSPAEVAGGP